MGRHLEIERKFLVKSNEFKNEALKAVHIVQGYLNSDPHRTVRVRLYGESGFLTVKGIPRDGGTTRFEWEKEIKKEDATALIALCEEGVIDKIRYEIKAGSHIYEVDEFMGENAGLLLAEIELNHAQEDFMVPSWLGKEVTGDLRYYNSQLSKKPFTSWN